MSNSKISALTLATTLSGTEVLPIVQSGATVKTSVSSLTVAGLPGAFSTLSSTENGSFATATATTSGIKIGSPLQALNAGSYVNFQNSNSGTNWQITANRISNNTLDFVPSTSGGGTTFSTPVLRLEALDVIAQQGNFIVNTAGKGIDFSATSGAGTSELLDDYEEGTFTPVVQGSSAAGTATYSAQNGLYTKIGNKVFFEIYVNYNTGTGTGNLRVGGLPFTSVAAGVYGSVSIGEFANIAMTALNVPAAECSAGGTYVEFYQNVVGGGAPTAIPYDAAGYIIFGGFFTTAA